MTGLETFRAIDERDVPTVPSSTQGTCVVSSSDSAHRTSLDPSQVLRARGHAWS